MRDSASLNEFAAVKNSGEIIPAFLHRNRSMQNRAAFLYRLHMATALACCIFAAAAAHGAGLIGGVRLAVLPQSWLDDDDRRISLSGFAGQRVVLTMAYANCHRICPMTIAGLKRLQASLDVRGQPAQFIVVGYDPDNENAATWSGYRKSHRRVGRLFRATGCPVAAGASGLPCSGARAVAAPTHAA
jgi:hypothetical protein